MAKAMTKSQVTEHLAGKVGITKKAAGEFLDHLAALAHKEAKNTFTLPGIGKLVLINRKARMGRNPQTGERINIPAKRVMKFRVARAAKEAILMSSGPHGAGGGRPDTHGHGEGRPQNHD